MSTSEVRVTELWTVKQVAVRLDVSPRTVWRLLARGCFPQPLRYSRKLVRWRASDVEGYLAVLAERRASADGPPVKGAASRTPAGRSSA